MELTINDFLCKRLRNSSNMYELSVLISPNWITWKILTVDQSHSSSIVIMQHNGSIVHRKKSICRQTVDLFKNKNNSVHIFVRSHSGENKEWRRMRWVNQFQIAEMAEAEATGMNETTMNNQLVRQRRRPQLRTSGYTFLNQPHSLISVFTCDHIVLGPFLLFFAMDTFIVRWKTKTCCIGKMCIHINWLK